MKLSEIRSKISDTFLVQLLPEAMRDRFVMVMLGISETEEVGSGFTLFKRGETNTDRGCLILEGMVKVTTADGEVKHLESPELLGEVQLFTPEAKRTATVDVVLGGLMLTFQWHELGKWAQEIYNAEELATLRERITHTARTRVQNLLQREGPSKGDDGISVQEETL